MMEGTNGGPSLGYAVAPYNNDYIVRNVIIQPRVTQNYKITFNLEGVGVPQNYDQNKHFEAMVDIELWEFSSKFLFSIFLSLNLRYNN